MRVESSRELPLTPATDPQPLLCRPVHELPALTVQPVSTASTARLWNEYIARYDYLGYTPLSGSQMRYEILAGSQRVALISFGASAWKLAAREHFIGWNEAQRQRNLQLVINNARFLVLLWIQSKGLASKILALIARQLPHDWQQRYGYRPVLFETFVETPRHRGICYKAANWIHIGQPKSASFTSPSCRSRTSGSTRSPSTSAPHSAISCGWNPRVHRIFTQAERSPGLGIASTMQISA
jgi:hypothetical protein